MAKKKKDDKPVKSKGRSLRERYESEFRNKGGGGFQKTIKPQQGDNYYRLLPTEDESETLCFRFEHWYNGRSIICPKTNGIMEDCAACDYSKELKKVDEKAGNDARAKKVFFVNVLHLENYPAKKLPTEVQVLRLGKQAVDSIMDLMHDEENEHGGQEPWGDDRGASGVLYDFCVKREGSGQFTTRYSVKMARKMRALGTPQAVLDSLIDLEAAFPVASSEEVEALVAGTKGNKKAQAAKAAAAAEDDDDDEDDEDEDLEDDETVDEDEDEDDSDDEDEDDDDSDDEDESDDDDDDDSEDEDDDDDEDIEIEDDDDDEDDEDEDDEPPAPTPVKKAAPKGKKKKDNKALASMLKSGKRKSA